MDDRLPWGTGAYGALGNTLFWFYRVDPVDNDRRGGTRGYDNASTKNWEFAALRQGRLDRIGHFQSQFSGAVLISQLRASPWGELYVAISGYDGSQVGMELVELKQSGSARLLWSGPSGDWPEILFDQADIIVDSTYQVARISRSGVLQEIRHPGEHHAACTLNSQLLLNTERRLRVADSAAPLRLGSWPEPYRFDVVCESDPFGIGIITRGALGRAFVSIRQVGVRRIQLDNEWWDLQGFGDAIVLYTRDANTLIVDDRGVIRQLMLPHSLRGFRVAPGTSSGLLFLIVNTGYVELERDSPGAPSNACTRRQPLLYCGPGSKFSALGRRG